MRKIQNIEGTCLHLRVIDLYACRAINGTRWMNNRVIQNKRSQTKLLSSSHKKPTHHPTRYRNVPCPLLRLTHKKTRQER